MNQNLTQNILKKIQDENITPTPRWTFFMKNSAVWGVGCAALAVGGLAMSVIIFMFVNNEWDLYEYVSDNFLSFVLVSLPYVWAVLLALFIFIADYNFRHTKHGYRYKVSALTLTSILISIVFGGIFYKVGLAETIDKTFSESMPLYTKVMDPKQRLLTQPERGIVGGVILTVGDEGIFIMKDLERSTWQVNATKARHIGPVHIRAGENIVVMGQRMNGKNFTAFQIKTLRHPLRLWYGDSFRERMMNLERSRK